MTNAVTQPGVSADVTARISREGSCSSRPPKVVLVHRGPRDSYEVAAALASRGMLQRLFTDIYWPGAHSPASQISRFVNARTSDWLQARWHERVPAALVQQIAFSGLACSALAKLSVVPESWQCQALRWTDLHIGKRAGQYAAKHKAILLSYSYYAAQAFRYSPGMLFQLHPHPESVRRILLRELADHPDCAQSLLGEFELLIPRFDFERLVSEPALADHCLVASSFTKQTLIENGNDPSKITVIPYGVDSSRFTPGDPIGQRSLTGPLRLLFVGTIAQRKGIKYLLEALKLLGHQQVEVTVCGRVVDDLSLFKPFAHQVNVRPSVSSSELLAAYQAADLFVFPSVAEGFAHVLLESMACGLPILSTTHTAAPDLVDEGVEGFVVEPRRPDLLAQRIEWALLHRRQLRSMRQAARARAEQFTLEKFRSGVVAAVRSYAQQKCN